MHKKQIFKNLTILIIWLALWEMLTLVIHSKLIMAGPLETGAAFLRLVTKAAVYKSMGYSVCRVLLGFILALFGALILAGSSYRYPVLGSFFAPALLFMRSIPVASFVIVALLWMGSRNLSVLIVVFVALPVLYSQLLSGFFCVQQKYRELAEVFHFTTWTKICAIYVPAMKEGVIAACRLAVGMSFKAGISAEVIAGSRGSIGEQLYLAKLYFSTGELFAWTVVIVGLSFVCERLTGWILNKGMAWMMSARVSVAGNLPRRREDAKTAPFAKISMEHVSKSFGEQMVISDLSLQAQAPEIVGVTGVSGIGKSTFLSLICEILKPDSGEVQVRGRTAVLFQDNRLIEHQDAVTNVAYALCSKHGKVSKSKAIETAQTALSKLLPEHALHQPVSHLSGGQRRRVELARTMLTDASLVVLDEPFAGLDEETKNTCMDFIRTYQNERLLVIAVHEKETLAGLEVKHWVELEELENDLKFADKRI